MRFRLAALFVALSIAATALFAHNPTTLTINEAQKKQPPVTFAHEKHTKIAKSCDTCHHMQKGLTEQKATADNVMKCSKCHLDPKDPKTPSMREMALTKNPFHIRCLTCHKEQKKGPTVCTGCHVKKA